MPRKRKSPEHMWMIKPRILALTLGSICGLLGAIWAFIVALGAAQPVMDWLMGVHFTPVAMTVAPFDALVAFKLIVLYFVGGAIFGWVFALFWNYFVKKVV